MNSDEFGRFFYEAHGVEPFPWQCRLAERVVTEGSWPEVIALPTSAGKTSVIDIAVCALASAARTTPGHRLPRRIFFVVDRRIVVDAAYDRALKLAHKLQEALDGGPSALRDAAERLLEVGGEVPLQVAVLRGGIYRDHAWARSPEQPLVCVSTVDQVGSRLLFRGYGLGTGPRNMLSVHAALVANDALIVLDEAHISRPFEETLVSLSRYRKWAEHELEAPWQAVRMSATPDPAADDVFYLDDEDRAHPELGRRLTASKPTELIRTDSREGLAQEAATQALRLLDDPGTRIVGVVVNRVATARSIFEALREKHETLLLVGRARPWDRDRLVAEYLERMRAGRTRAEDDPPLIVVATQCIEVGADVDFDALVTECAALDALRQRFGRLDRLGHRGSTPAVVLAAKEDLARGHRDFVYAEALAASWGWLKDQLPTGRVPRGTTKTIDMGVMPLEQRLPGPTELAALCSPRPNSPVLLPAYLDLWAQTSPIPHPEPDVGLFLHGPESGPADVQIVWRADLAEDAREAWADIVALTPPCSAEAMPVPLRTAREWLAQVHVEDVADTEGLLVETSADSAIVERGRPALRWHGIGADGTGIVSPGQIRPGDTLVVPSSYGGADRYGWDPASKGPVLDIADAVSFEQRQRPVFRLLPATIPAVAEGFAEEALDVLIDDVRALVQAIEADEPTSDLEQEILERITGEAAAPDWARRCARALLGDARRRRIPYPDGRGVVLVGSRHRSGAALRASDEITDEDEASSLTRPVSLTRHQAGVCRWVSRFAASCRLPSTLADDLVLAASVHDLGKADPRFQIMLYAGDEVAAALADEPLAKSGMDPRDRAAFRRAWQRSGLLPGYAHEATSVALAQSAQELFAGARDAELVLHLVASHHGRARPFLPAINEQSPVLVRTRHENIVLESSSAHGLARLDSGVSDRFWRLIARYGWYGLAYLEAILRLADNRESEAEAEGES